MVGPIAGNTGETPSPTPPGRPSLPGPLAHLNPGVPTALVHFLVHPLMAEVQAFAHEHGWPSRGFTVLSIAWLEMHYTTDGWATSRVCRSSDVPSPVINGWYYLLQVRSGEEVEFAVQAGIGCRAPEDRAGLRDQGAVWFNNGAANYRQTAR